MGYMHINNLHRATDILLFKRVYALEKIHGTSAHLSFRRHEDGTATVAFFSGGEKHDNFVALFNQEELKALFLATGVNSMTVYGEAYGGKQQGMKDTYGPQLKFVAFDVLMGNEETSKKVWLGVESAELLVRKLGLEFVAWNMVDTDLESLAAERDLPSRQAVRNGIMEPRKAEGVVLRPPIEVRTNNGGRIIAKFKRDDFSERTSKRDTSISAEKLVILEKADEIAAEWVTEMRLVHVIDKLHASLQRELRIEDTKLVIASTVEDVTREAGGEIVESKEATRAISSAAAHLFKKHLNNSLRDDPYAT